MTVHRATAISVKFKLRKARDSTPSETVTERIKQMTERRAAAAKIGWKLVI